MENNIVHLSMILLKTIYSMAEIISLDVII